MLRMKSVTVFIPQTHATYSNVEIGKPTNSAGTQLELHTMTTIHESISQDLLHLLLKYAHLWLR